MGKVVPKIFHVKKSLVDEFFSLYPVDRDIVSSSFSGETCVVVDDQLTGCYVCEEEGKYKGVLFVGFNEFRLFFDAMVKSWSLSVCDDKLDHKLLMGNIVNELS